MILLPGDNIGPYHIIERVGQGGMATVYKATQTTLDRYVALKVLHPALAGDQSFLTRFHREARIVAKLIHPNIIPIYDFAEQDGTPYLVLQYVEGRTLKTLLGQGPLPLVQVLTVMRPVAAALDYAHSQGVLHRDIKPSNIICANDGQIFLMDFGLASLAESRDPSLSQNMIIGTPQYISPEQARGEPATERSDTYSLGVVLFEMLAGRVPFDADAPMTIIHDHIYAAPPSPRSLNPAISEAAEKALLRGLAKEPGDRFASAGEMIDALELPVKTETAAVAVRPQMAPAPPVQKTETQPSVPKRPPLAPAVKTPTSPTPPTPAPAKKTPVRPKLVQASGKPGRKRIWPFLVAGGLVLVLLCVISSIAFLSMTGLGKTLVSFATQGSALRTAQTAVANRPRDPIARVALGDVYAADRQYNLAFAEYDTAISLDPRNPRAYEQAGALGVSIGDFVRADRYYVLGRASSPNDIGLLLAQGDMFAKLKRYTEATDNYQRVQRLAPGNATPIWRLGSVDAAQGRTVQAVGEYVQAAVTAVASWFR